jgi:Uma2 family endonuclease
MTALTRIDNPPLVLHLRPAITLSDEEFFAFCRQNPELRIECSAEGVVEIRTLLGAGSSHRNVIVTHRLADWAVHDGTGVVFDSSCGHLLPNEAMRAPSATWVPRALLTPLTPEQKERFLPFCPDFVIEVRSPSDSLVLAHEKMREYIENGALLGWLLDIPSKQAFVYRPDHPVEQLDAPTTLSGEPALLRFTLDLSRVWKLDF